MVVQRYFIINFYFISAMRHLIFVFIAMVAILLILLFTRNQETYFKSIDLNDRISIENRDLPSYYDTILNVAMSQQNLSHHRVILIPLSEATKTKFEGGIKASLRYANGDFYLFIDELDRSKAINVIAHEVVHMQQYSSKRLSYNNNTGELAWNGSKYSLDTEYENRPWEIEAFDNQSKIEKLITKTLY